MKKEGKCMQKSKMSVFKGKLLVSHAQNTETKYLLCTFLF